MKERPILFSAPMIKAILSGTKTQTRRIIKPQPLHFGQNEQNYIAEDGRVVTCRYGIAGDRLWVRETFADTFGMGFDTRFHYAADTNPGSEGDCRRKEYGVRWKPSIHMPRVASRITLEITEVWPERLQDISENDAMAEGVQVTEFYQHEHPPSICFSVLWEAINGKGSWAANAYVWVVAFRRVKP